MIMTQKTTPTGSARSIALIACVTLIGWLATPALSLDEKPKPCDKNSPAAKTCSGTSAQSGAKLAETCVKTCTEVGVKSAGTNCPEIQVVSPQGATLSAGRICVETSSCAPKPAAGVMCVNAPRAPTAPPCAAAVPAAPALLMALGDEDDDNLAARMDRLERHLEQLAKKLDQLSGYKPSEPLPPLPPMQPKQMEAYQEAMKKYKQFVVPDLSAAQQITDLSEVVRTYKLPAGRLEALTELMKREDVPVRVRPVDGGIEVHGPEWVQANFKAFVDIITADKAEKPVTYKLSKGKHDALQALMERSDVPVIVTPGENEIVVHGNAATQAVFRNFVNMIEGEAVRKTGDVKSGWFSVESDAQAEFKKQKTKTKKLAEEYRIRAEQAARSSAIEIAKSGRKAHRSAVRELEQAIKELTRNTDRIEREIERLEGEADRFEQKAEEMQRKADALREKAEQAGNEEEADKLHERADAATEQANQMVAQVEQIRDQVLNMEDQAESMEDQVEMLEEKLAQLEEEDENGDA